MDEIHGPRDRYQVDFIPKAPSFGAEMGVSFQRNARQEWRLLES